MVTGKLLGRAVGSGYCACPACNRPDMRRDRRRQRQRERRQWVRDVWEQVWRRERPWEVPR